MTRPDGDEFVLLVDPEWQEEDGDPPFDAVVGLWPLGADGLPGEFRPNPEYRPRFENSPADPVDAALRLVLGGELDQDQLRTVLAGCLVEVALNGDGRPMVVRADDSVLCATIATSGVHRQRLASPDWRRLSAVELLELLAEGTDVLVNPGGPAEVRLAHEFLLETAATGAARRTVDDPGTEGPR